MTIAEAAKRLGVSVRTINNYFNDQRLKRVKINGKLVRVRRAEVEAIIAARPTPSDWSDTMSIAETAARLGVSTRMVNNYFHDGRLTRIKVDGGVRVARTEVEDLLAKRWCNGQTTIDPATGVP